MSIPNAASAPWAHSYDCLISNVNLTTFLANGGTITINTKSGANTITVPAGSTVAGVVALINANTTIRSDAWTAKAGTNGIIMSLNTWDVTLMTLTVDGADWVVTRQAINYQTTLSGILGAAALPTKLDELTVATHIPLESIIRNSLRIIRQTVPSRPRVFRSDLAP